LYSTLTNYIQAIIEVVELLPNTKDLNELIKIYLSENEKNYKE